MLTDDELATVRAEVGAEPDDAELNEIHDRVETVGGVIYTVLAERHAELLASPAQFSIPGEYSQSTAANLQALRAQLERWMAFAPDDVAPPELGVIQLESRHAR